MEKLRTNASWIQDLRESGKIKRGETLWRTPAVTISDEKPGTAPAGFDFSPSTSLGFGATV